MNKIYLFILLLVFIVSGGIAYILKNNYSYLQENWFFEGILFIGLINMTLYVGLAVFFKENFNNGDFKVFQMSFLMICFLVIPHIVKKFPW